MNDKVVRVGSGSISELRAIIDEGRFAMVFQPIHELQSNSVLGYEALTRFTDEPERGPQWWFEQAARAGVEVELELATARAAMAHLAELPEHAFLSLNASPHTLVTQSVSEMVAGVARRLVMEVLETSAVEDYDVFGRALRPLRRLGVRLALDDMGAGFARLPHLFRMQPDIVKLDMGLIRDIDADPVRQTLASAIAAYAAESGALVVAEGIETEAELVTLRLLGVQAGQGFLLGRPAALSH